MAMTGAERAKKFRDNRTLKVLNIDLDPKEIRRKILNAQKSYLHSTGLKHVKNHEESVNEFFFMVEDLNLNGCYIFKRIFKKHSSKSCMVPLNPQLLSREQAEAEFKEIVEKKSFKWKTIDHYLEKAAIFEVKWKNDPKSNLSSFPTNQFSFLMSLYEISTDGYRVTFDGMEYAGPGKKNSSPNRMKSLARHRRYLTHLFANPTLPPFKDLHAWQNILFKMFEAIALDVNEEEETSFKTYKEKGACLLKMIDQLTRYVSVFGPEVLSLPHLANSQYNDVYEIYKGTTIVPSESYQRIPLETLERLLDRLWEQDVNDFHTVLLGLSQLLRPTELERLLENPSMYIQDNCFLDYKSGKLITKTLLKTKMSNLPNPYLQIVSRLILFHYPPKYSDFNFSKKLLTGYRQDPEFEDCFFRRFRTTGAVMIKYCDTDFEAQSRLAHTTNQMLNNTYGPLMPSVENPQQYLKFKDGKFSLLVNEKKEIVSKQSNLWDLWLLRVFMKHHLSTMKSPEEEIRFKQLCIIEAKKFDMNKGGDSSDMEESVL